MKRVLILAMLMGICGSRGASVKAGKERLRELVVVPQMNVTSTYTVPASKMDSVEDHLVPAEIDKLRRQAKEHPEDPECLFRLGAFFERDGQTNEVRGWFEQAEQAARKKLAARPQDGVTLICLANTLDRLGNDAEAESDFRKATLVSSNEWKCWVGLGSFLGAHELTLLLPKEKVGETMASPATLMSVIADFRPSPDALAKAESMRKEADQCFARGVSLAPNEADAYLARAAIQLDFGITDFLVRYYRDKAPLDAKQVLRIYHSPDAVLYLQAASRLCPDDARIVGVAAWYEGLCEMFEVVQESGNLNPSLVALPEKTQASLRGAISCLETLSQDPDKERASAAWERLGFLKFMLHDTPGAKSAFRRAVTLEPAREKAWEMLLAVTVSSGAPPEEMEGICRSLLKTKNSARNHLLLAKVLIKRDQADDAAAQIKEATDLEPRNVLGYLFGGALVLKFAKDEGTLSLATQELAVAKPLLQKMPADEDKRQRWREFVLNCAILNGLTDKPDEAKDWLKTLQDQFPDDEIARQILNALN